MNKLIKLFAALFIACTAIPGSGAQDLPSMKTLKSMLLANMYYIQKWPDPARPVAGSDLPGNSWTRGVYFEGLVSLYKINPNDAFLSYMLNWGKAFNWSLPGGSKTRDAFNQSCGQTYIDLYLMDRYKEERIKAVRACIDDNITSEKTDDWTSTDAVQMAMPVYARLGNIYNDSKYFDRMHQMYTFTKSESGGKGLYNPDDHLWYGDKDFLPPFKEPNGADCYWSRGNGWIISALVRTLEFIDKGKYRKEYETTLKEMFEALVPLQRADGYWNISLKDPDHFGGKELTGTALIVYGMAWGINNDLISSKEYLPVVMKAWNAILAESLHTDGSLGYVQGAAKGPGDGQPVGYESKQDFEDVGLGCFLLAGSEMYKLQKNMEPKEKVKKEKVENEKPGKNKQTRTKK